MSRDAAATAVPPAMMWAQNFDELFLTVTVECKDVDYKFTEDSFHFKAVGVADNKLYEATLTFLHKINTEKVQKKNLTRCIEFTIPKAESGPYWTNLTNDKKKPAFLKVDFNKWVDEDSQNEDGGARDGGDFASQFDLGSLTDPSRKQSFDDFEEESDSDDEHLPNLE